MKNLKMLLIAFFVLPSLLLSACGTSSEISFPEPAVRTVEDPFMIWPNVYNPASNTYYQKVSRPHVNYIEGSMPGLWTDSELIPLSPLTPKETSANLSIFEIVPTEEYVVITLPSSWNNEETGEEVTSSDLISAATITQPTPAMCVALIGHMIFHVSGVVTFEIVTGAVQAWSEGSITPTVIKQGAGGATAVQFVYQGIKFLILYGDSAIPPTVFGPVLGNTLGRMAGGLNNLVVGKGKAVNVVQETISLFQCVKSNWPKSPDDLKRMKDEHNKTYRAKHLEVIPEQFPVPFPNPTPEGALKEDIMITVVAGDFSNVDALAMKFLFASGIVVLVAAVPGPADEAVAGAYYLKWSSTLAFAP